MAQVFNHLPPFKRLVDYITHRLSELQVERDHLVNEVKMWETFPRFANSDVPVETRKMGNNYVRRRMLDLPPKIAALNFEMRECKSLLLMLDPCQTCGGRGFLVDHVDEGETVRLECPTCKGDGATAQ